jgi:hypothetical protein
VSGAPEHSTLAAPNPALDPVCAKSPSYTSVSGTVRDFGPVAVLRSNAEQGLNAPGIAVTRDHYFVGGGGTVFLLRRSSRISKRAPAEFVELQAPIVSAM